MKEAVLFIAAICILWSDIERLAIQHEDRRCKFHNLQWWEPFAVRLPVLAYGQRKLFGLMEIPPSVWVRFGCFGAWEANILRLLLKYSKFRLLRQSLLPYIFQ